LSLVEELSGSLLPLQTYFLLLDRYRESRKYLDSTILDDNRSENEGEMEYQNLGFFALP
jgi:hypothetical protein